MNAISPIKVEHGVPIPPKRGEVEYIQKYPFRQMGIGDSFLCKEKQATIRRAASIAGKRHGMKFTTRQVTIDGEVHVRVWRTK